MSFNRQNVAVDIPASRRIPRGPRRAHPVLRRLLPHPQLDRSPTQRLSQTGDLGVKLLLPPRGTRPDGPAANAVLPASRKSAFCGSMDCSDTSSLRAAPAVDISPASRLITIQAFRSVWTTAASPMVQVLLQTDFNC